MINGEKLAQAGFKYLGTPYSQMDCQAFVERCIADCGIRKDLAGSNAWFREVMSHGAVMTPEECVQQLGTVPPGAFLFILQQDGGEPAKYRPDGLGNASHIGIVTGQGEGAIHSSASRGCVAESKFRNKTISGGWNRIGLWDQVSFDFDGAIPVPGPEPDPDQETLTATVVAPSGKNVNLRQSPSTAAALVDRIRLGETVTVLTAGQDWSQVKWKWHTGWMMSKFLMFDESRDDRVTVMIDGLTRDEAEAIKKIYPTAVICVG